MRPEFEDFAPKCSERVRIKTGLNAYTYSPVLLLHQPHGHGQGHCKPFAAQYCFKHTTRLQYTSIFSNKCFVCECTRMPHQLRATPHLHSVETRCDKRIGFVIGHVFGNHQHPHVPGNHPAIWKVTEFACCTPHKIFLINDENITIKKYSSFCLSLSFFYLAQNSPAFSRSVFPVFFTQTCCDCTRNQSVSNITKRIKTVFSAKGDAKKPPNQGITKISTYGQRNL